MPSSSLQLHKWYPWVLLNRNMEKEESLSQQQMRKMTSRLVQERRQSSFLSWKQLCILVTETGLCLLPEWPEKPLSSTRKVWRSILFLLYTFIYSLLCFLLSLLPVGYDEPIASLLHSGSSISLILTQGRVPCSWSTTNALCPCSHLKSPKYFHHRLTLSRPLHIIIILVILKAYLL